ncbi:MAG: ABC transporter permease [Armatimonadota bacterium]
MSRLWLKLFRDIRAYRVQAIGIAVVVMLSISMYHSFYLAYRSMGATYQWAYQHLRLADFTIELTSAPEETVTRLAAIPGVSTILGRIKEEVRVEQEAGRRRVVTGRILSLPDSGREQINRLMVLEGQYLGPPDRRELLLEQSFARAHHYRVGDMIYPVVDGVRHSFRVVGIVSSVEYIYVVRSKDNLFPTPESFGVMWIRRRQAERLTGMFGQISEIAVMTAPGQRDRVMQAMYADLRRFGAQLPVPQEEQPSRNVLDQDLAQLGQFAVIFPALFIGSAALTVYSILSRTVERERGQVGFLRACGLPAWRVGAQYLAFAGLLGTVGVIPGVILGQWFALGITRMYLDLLGLPFLRLASGWFVALIGVAVTAVTCVVAGWSPALHAARMRPAEAMRPGVPSTAQRKPPALLARLQRTAPFVVRVAVSNLFRQRHRTAYTIIGIAAGMVLMITTMSMYDMQQHMLRYYFDSVRNYDVDVGFAPPASDAIVEQVKRWPGVQWAEGTSGLPVRLSHGDEHRDLTITGVPRGSRLQRFRDPRGRLVQLQGEGIFPSPAAARALGIESGDLLKLEYAYNSRQVRLEQPVRVSGAVQQPIGSGVYMVADVLQRRFGSRLGVPPGTIGGLIIKARPGYEQAVAARAYDLPDAVTVETTFDLRRQLDQAMAMTLTFIAILMAFAGTLTVAIVYNTIASNVSERRSEIASLRALGVRMAEVTRMITIENLAATALGLLAGVPLGTAGARGLVELWESESFTFTFYISPWSFAVSIVFTIVLVLVCQVPALREIARMNLALMTRLHGE